MLGYETRYLIVAGIGWIRWTRVADVEDIWLITFGDEPRAAKGPAGGNTIFRGQLDGVAWYLRAEDLALPLRSPHALLRPVASTQMETQPAQLFTGHIGGRAIARAPGHSAHLWGRRHAQSWGWAHATLADGRWAHLLTATVRGLPRVSQYATSEHGPSLPFVRGIVTPPAVRVGPFTVTAEPVTFIGLRYRDTDGSTIWCYHSERARLIGPGFDIDGAAMEIARREPLEGWSVAL
jgi:hypothetical protein